MDGRQKLRGIILASEGKEFCQENIGLDALGHLKDKMAAQMFLLGDFMLDRKTCPGVKGGRDRDQSGFFRELDAGLRQSSLENVDFDARPVCFYKFMAQPLDAGAVPERSFMRIVDQYFFRFMHGLGIIVWL